MEQNTLFARTVVVKLKEAAELINEKIVLNYGSGSVDSYDPESWKYYLNLSGQYHFSDTPMSVVSIDTLEPIQFTLENLRLHTATAEAHRYGTRHYYALVLKYPEQELLINGILNPVNIQDAIAAENGDILTYPAHLIEPNELTLILDLEAYLKRQFARWYNVQFAMSDNLFCAAFFTSLHLFILPKLLNLRLLRCKTSEVHSFHVRMYLASHEKLDRYLPYLTLKQSLWLYRNICYLERNSGKVVQFAKLIDHLLTERDIPIGEYSVRHLDSFDQVYKPEQLARIKILNTNANILAVDYHSVEALFQKEIPVASDNEVYLDTYQATEIDRFKWSPSSIIQTKALHSSMVDYSDAVPEPFEMVALRQWCYMANHGLYDVVINFKDPKTAEPLALFAREAFIYMQYIALSAEGLTFTTFPEFLNMQQRIHPLPSIETLLSVTDQDRHDLRAVAEALWTRQPLITPCYSVTSFYAQVRKLTDEAYWHWFLISSMEDLYERGMVENMVKRLYEDVRMVYDVSDMDVATWLDVNNLPVYDLDQSEAKLLIKSIYEAATGLKVDDTKQLKNIQKALIDLTMELSSYSIQTTYEINTDDIISIRWPAIRIGNIRATQTDQRQVDNGSLVQDGASHSSEKAHVGTDIDHFAIPKECPTQLRRAVEIDPVTTAALSLNMSHKVNDVGAAHIVSMTYVGQDEVLENDLLLPGYTSFNRLSEIQRQSLKFKQALF